AFVRTFKSASFAALLGGTPVRRTLGACSVAMIDLHSPQTMSTASCSLLFAFITSKIIGCVLLQVGHHTRGTRSFRSRATVALCGIWALWWRAAGRVLRHCTRLPTNARVISGPRRGVGDAKSASSVLVRA